MQKIKDISDTPFDPVAVKRADFSVCETGFPCLDKNAAEKMKGSPLCYQVTMSAEECERSALAMDAVKRM